MGRTAVTGRPKSLSRAAARPAQRTAAGEADPYDPQFWDDIDNERDPDGPLPSETEEYWNPPHLYHGTSVGLKPGESVEPGHGPNLFGAGTSLNKGRRYSYATPHIHQAWEYAENAAAHRGGQPRVYEVDRAHDMLPDPESGYAVGGPQMIQHPGWRSPTGFRVLRELEPHETGEHTAAARWAPSSGIFAPTTGLDHRLFGSDFELRPEVRGALMERLDQALRVDTGLAGSDWQGWLKIYLAGGSASEWAGNRPNDQAQDLDVLIGVDYAGARAHSAFPGMDDDQIDAALNAAFRSAFNDPDWHAPFGGTWGLTAYANPQAWDIRAIKPYAAYDVSDMDWAVRPPHLPEHTLADFDPAVIAQARAIATEARAILRLPEPLRTREATALWERLHAERRQAFSIEGEGWTDPGNVAEKWLAYAPGNLLGQIRDLALAPKTAAAEPYAPEFEPSVRNTADLGWGPDEWAEAKREPWHASSKLAQQQVRNDHPKLTMPFPHGEEGDAMVGHLLRHAGYQGPTEGSFVSRHPDPSKRTSNPAWLNGSPGVTLHPERWDYGTAAHEAAHHVVMYDHAVAPNTPQPDEQIHGPEWAGHYAAALNKISKNAGDDFLYHHARFRSMISEGLRNVRPSDLADAEKRLPPPRWVDDDVYPAPTRLASTLELRADAATHVGVIGYDGLTSRTAMIYLDLPDDAVHHLDGGVDDHHITVVYLGKNVSDEAFEEACRRARAAAARSHPLAGILRGVETFPASDSSGQKTPVFVPAYVPGIGALRRALEDLSGSEHRQYRPHVTLAYLEPGDDLPAPHPKVDVRFSHLHVKRGDQVVSFPLGRSQ